MTIRIGTRNSPLARWQAEMVAARLEDEGTGTVLVPVQTTADRFQQTPLQGFGGVGAFTIQLERALLDSEVDIAVHSLKDLPTQNPPDLVLGAILARDFVEDVWISRDGRDLADLPPRATVGTSSIRRKAMLLARRPQDSVIEWRGNLNTRLSKLESRTDVAGILLSRAGLERMNWGERITTVLPVDWFLPAPGQGVVAVQCRRDDKETLDLLASLDDAETRLCVTAERRVLSECGAGCVVPLGAMARSVASGYLLEVALLHPDGSPAIRFAVEAADEEGLVSQAVARLRAEPLLHTILEASGVTR